MKGCCNHPFKWQPWMKIPSWNPTPKPDPNPDPDPVCVPQAVLNAQSGETQVEEGGSLPTSAPLALSTEGSVGTSFLWQFSDSTPDKTDSSLLFDPVIDTLDCGPITITLTAFCEPNQQGDSDSATLSFTIPCG